MKKDTGMRKLKVNIEWCNKNYAAAVAEGQVPGVIVVTDKTLEGVEEAIAEAVAFHVEGMLADGDIVPEWLKSEDYEFEWMLGASALLRSCEKYTSIAAISRASGINERQLSHYANGIKTPRKRQRERIVNGIHKIGQEFLSVR